MTDVAGLVHRAKTGQVAAAEQLVDLYSPRLYGLLYRMTGSPADAEDLLQETYLKMLRSLGRYQENGRFEPWLFSIAANLARDWLRRQGRSPATVRLSAADDAAEILDTIAAPQAADSLVATEQVDQLQRALNALSPAEREVVSLRFFSDLSFKEIAQVLKIPLGTALARAHRALNRLRERLQADES